MQNEAHFGEDRHVFTQTTSNSAKTGPERSPKSSSATSHTQTSAHLALDGWGPYTGAGQITAESHQAEESKQKEDRSDTKLKEATSLNGVQPQVVPEVLRDNLRPCLTLT